MQVDVPDAPTAKRTDTTRPQLSADQLTQAYRVAVRSRAVEEHIVRMASRGDVKFAIWGPGEEIHGTATALALHHTVDPSHFGMVCHYRSGSLASMWCELNGVTDFTERMLRQQFSRATDPMSAGRQMVYHLNVPEVGILPIQSPVGMQLGKAAGYALGFRKRGIGDGVAMGIVGDGTTAEGDMHDAMHAARVWRLPLIIMVTDNGVAISTTPDEGRGIVDFEAYARSFDVRHASCDGRDFDDVYRTTVDATSYVRDQQAPVLLHVRDLPRFNGHSSAADMSFDLSQADPLVAFGELLVAQGHVDADDVLRRIDTGTGRDFFAHHALGTIMAEEDDKIRVWIEAIRQEPEPDPATLYDHILAPLPTTPETPAASGTTNITYAGAIRSALDKLVRRRGGLIVGQDVAKLGGVMTATAGLLDRHPDAIVDSPLNEPLIVGTATGFGLHEGVMALPEVQFGDYSLNTFHWLVHLGNIRWTTAGGARSKVVLRMPTDPFGGGAVYHSMSVDGFFCSIPGLVIVMPSTSFDVHGLLLTAGDYEGPVICLEPKWMYRQSLGPAFPGEPTDPDAIRDLKKRLMRAEVPDLPDVYVPFGKAARRRAGGDLTLVAWGRAVHTAMKAAETLATQGIEADVLDLRTLVPPDMDMILESVGRTGRLLVAAEDRPFGGFAREIQGAVVQRLPGLPTVVVGQENVPGVAQSPVLEAATVLNDTRIVEAATELLRVQVAGRGGWSWIPNRYFVG